MRCIKIPIPDRCSICNEPINLYTPYHTVKLQRNISGMKIGFTEQTVFCQHCYRAYKDFLIERTVQENHKKTMKELR